MDVGFVTAQAAQFLSVVAVLAGAGHEGSVRFLQLSRDITISLRSSNIFKEELATNGIENIFTIIYK